MRKLRSREEKSLFQGESVASCFNRIHKAKLFSTYRTAKLSFTDEKQFEARE